MGNQHNCYRAFGVSLQDKNEEEEEGGGGKVWWSECHRRLSLSILCYRCRATEKRDRSRDKEDYFLLSSVVVLVVIVVVVVML